MGWDTFLVLCQSTVLDVFLSKRAVPMSTSSELVIQNWKQIVHMKLDQDQGRPMIHTLEFWNILFTLWLCLT